MVWNFIKQLWKSGAIWGMIVVTIVISAYQVVKPTKLELSVRQREVLSDFSEEVEAWCNGIKLPRGTLVFLAMDRDDFGRVSDAARLEVWRSDVFDLADYSVLEKLRREIDWTRPTAGSAAEAVKRAGDSDYAIWGRVREFSDAANLARLDVHMELLDVASGETLLSKDFDLSRTSMNLLGKMGNGVAADEDSGFLISLAIWAVFVIILPIICYPLTLRVVIGDSNILILLLLTAYVLSGFLAAFLLFAYSGTVGGTILKAVILLLAFALTSLYNWKALDLIKTLNE